MHGTCFAHRIELMLVKLALDCLFCRSIENDEKLNYGHNRLNTALDNCNCFKCVNKLLLNFHCLFSNCEALENVQYQVNPYNAHSTLKMMLNNFMAYSISCAVS